MQKSSGVWSGADRMSSRASWMSVTTTCEHTCQGSTCKAQLGGRVLVYTLSSSVLPQQTLNTMASKPFAPLLLGHPVDGDSGYDTGNLYHLQHDDMDFSYGGEVGSKSAHFLSTITAALNCLRRCIIELSFRCQKQTNTDVVRSVSSYFVITVTKSNPN